MSINQSTIKIEERESGENHLVNIFTATLVSKNSLCTILLFKPLLLIEIMHNLQIRDDLHFLWL